MKPKLIVIVGTNASGKSSLGVELAARFNGEIVSADSRQVYERLNLGSGKITPDEMHGVPHHLLDVRKPGEFFSMADFQELAYETIDAIIARGHVPFLVGGTGLYVDAVADGYVLSDMAPDAELREELEKLSTPELYELLKEKVPDTDIEPKNRHRVMRMLEKLAAGDTAPTGKQPRYDVLKLGVTWDRETLKARIDERLDRRLEQGMVAETEALLQEGIPDEFMLKLGLEYKYLTRYIRGELEFEQMKEELGNAIKKFAKRQMTWFRKDPRIIWLNMHGNPADEAERYIRKFLESTDRPADEIPSLCEAYAGKFRIGEAAGTHWLFAEPYTGTVLKHFNSLTAENDMKPWSILDRKKTLENGDMLHAATDFSRCDRILDFAREHHVPVRFHTLVWHNQTPRWFFAEKWSDREDAPTVSAEIMGERMKNYIRDVMIHVNNKYPGTVYCWDVVNEAIEPEHGAPGMYRSRNSLWYQIMGESFIRLAFGTARQYAAEGQKLFYNDYNSFQAPKQDAILEMLNGMTEDGLVDGMGMQAHLLMEWPSVAEFTEALKRYAATGLTIELTELDIHCPSDSDEMQKQLADRYRDLFTSLLKLQEDGTDIDCVTFWGVSDKDSWLTGFRREGSWPLLFDERLQPKPAFDATIAAACNT